MKFTHTQKNISPCWKKKQHTRKIGEEKIGEQREEEGWEEEAYQKNIFPRTDGSAIYPGFLL